MQRNTRLPRKVDLRYPDRQKDKVHGILRYRTGGTSVSLELTRSTYSIFMFLMNQISSSLLNFCFLARLIQILKHKVGKLNKSP